MRVTYEREGGLAAFPGLSRPFTIDTSEMPSEQADKLQSIVGQLSPAATLRAGAAAPQGAADGFRYTITIEVGKRRRVVRAADPVADEGVQALIAFMEECRRA